MPAISQQAVAGTVLGSASELSRCPGKSCTAARRRTRRNPALSCQQPRIPFPQLFRYHDKADTFPSLRISCIELPFSDSPFACG